MSDNRTRNEAEFSRTPLGLRLHSAPKSPYWYRYNEEPTVAELERRKADLKRRAENTHAGSKFLFALMCWLIPVATVLVFSTDQSGQSGLMMNLLAYFGWIWPILALKEWLNPDEE